MKPVHYAMLCISLAIVATSLFLAGPEPAPGCSAGCGAASARGSDGFLHHQQGEG